MMDLNGDLIGLVIGFGLLRRGFVVDFVGSWYFCWIDRNFGAAARHYGCCWLYWFLMDIGPTIWYEIVVDFW